MNQSIVTINDFLKKITEEGRKVCIHFHGNGIVIRNTGYIDEYKVNVNGFYFVSGDYVSDLESNIIESMYIEEENSLYIKFSNDSEMYFDELI